MTVRNQEFDNLLVEAIKGETRTIGNYETGHCTTIKLSMKPPDTS